MHAQPARLARPSPPRAPAAHQDPHGDGKQRGGAVRRTRRAATGSTDPKHGQARRSVVTSPPAAQQRAQAADACALLRGGGAALVSRAVCRAAPHTPTEGGPSQLHCNKIHGLGPFIAALPLLGNIGGKIKQVLSACF